MKDFQNAFLYFIGFLTIVLTHYLIFKFGVQSELDFTQIYLFTTSMCLLVLLSIALFNKIIHKQLGFIFLGIVFLKLFVAKLFMMNFEEINVREYKISFIVLYLFSLVLITIFTSRLLLNLKK